MSVCLLIKKNKMLKKLGRQISVPGGRAQNLNDADGYLFCESGQGGLTDLISCDPLAEHWYTAWISWLNCVNMERKVRKRGGDYCSAYGCHNSRNNCSLSFFGFPKDEERLVYQLLFLYSKTSMKLDLVIVVTFHT